MVPGSYLSIITLNVNGLNAPTKRQRLAEWIQKQDPSICCLQETHLKTRDTYRLKVKGWKKIYHVNRDEKKAGVAILISSFTFIKRFFSYSLLSAIMIMPSVFLRLLIFLLINPGSLENMDLLQKFLKRGKNKQTNT